MEDISVPKYKVPIRVDVDELSPVYPDIKNDVPLIVHSSTNLTIKSTPVVLKTIKKLEGKYRFRFKLIHNLPRDEALNIVRRCDIFLDQFVLGHYGVAAEAMALGKPVNRLHKTVSN